jgi:hypothetical protein
MKILLFHAHADNPVSFLIKAITRSPYCHAAILVDTPKWRAAVVAAYSLGVSTEHVIIEALFPKVHARFLLPEELSEIDVFEVPSHTPDREDLSMQWLMTQIGVAYDIKDLLRFLPEGREALGEASDTSYEQHTFCSMLDTNAYRFGGTRLFSSYLHDFNTTPEMLSWSPIVEPAPKLT